MSKKPPQPVPRKPGKCTSASPRGICLAQFIHTTDIGIYMCPLERSMFFLFLNFMNTGFV